ncbi:MAG: hypothetical protein ACR2L3_00345 [Actinomycetota bacterium]
MSSQFTTEIGRMRSAEMIDRGLRYQQLEIARRNTRGSDDRPPRPVDRRVLPPARRRSALRVPALTALVMMLLVSLSSVAFAYPAAPGGRSASGSAAADLTPVEVHPVTLINGGWVLGTALAALLLLAFFQLLRRSTLAKA